MYDFFTIEEHEYCGLEIDHFPYLVQNVVVVHLSSKLYLMSVDSVPYVRRLEV